LIARLPDVALLWRLSVVREVILSGFQLELYGREERSFAYWYAVEVIDAHLSCLDNLTSIVQEGAHSYFSCFWFMCLVRPNTFLDTEAYLEMVYQSQFLTALRSICAALFIVSLPSSFDWAQIPLNFFRRYKWAFRSCYDDSETPVVASPELYRFINACDESKKVKMPLTDCDVTKN
jgi:hypothetical protein